MMFCAGFTGLKNQLRLRRNRCIKSAVEHLESRAMLAADGYALGVTGGAGGTVVTVTTASAFNSYIKQTAPYIIQVQGTIDLRTLDPVNNPNGRVFTQGNKSILGIGANPTVLGNLNITNGVSNVIVQNLYWSNPQDGADGLTIWNGHNVWVNHCNIYDCGDGLTDTNNGSNDVTISWCKFYYPTRTAHKFTMINDGTSAVDRLRITLHHNWWYTGCDQRMPASSYGQVHTYNNYFSCTGNFYCQNARTDTLMLSENNYFESVNDPVTVSAGTNGKIRTVGNIYHNTTGTIYAGTDTVFTPGYAYTLDATANVPALVMASAGVLSPPTVATPAAAGAVVKNGNDFLVNSTGANGAYTTLQAALDAAPSGTASKRTRIFISPGTYTQQVTVSKPFVSLIGLGATSSDTVLNFNLGSVSGNWNASTTVTSAATDFVASNLTFTNTLGDNMGQALALHTSGDRGAFSNCRFLGFQDTLLTDNNSRQYFKNCYVTGDTDFIYGNATAVFDKCTINSSDRQYITAAETNPTTANGLIFLDCTLTTTGAANGTTYLGRPWHWDQGKIPSVIYIRTKMGPHIIAAGWNPWSTLNTTPDVNTRYSEYGSMDANGNLLALNASGVPNGRVSWADPMTAAQAANYTLANIFGPASFWTAATQPETTGQTYVDQGAPWDPAAALSALNYGPGYSVPLSALGADDGGEANLTYTWAATTKPAGAPAPTFSSNGLNASKNTVANNLVPGSYVFTVTITDANGLVVYSSTSTVTVVLSSLTGTLNNDTIRFVRSGTNLNIFVNDLVTPLYTVPFAGQGAIAIDALAGSDSIEVVGTSAAGTTTFSTGAINFESLSLTYSNNESLKYDGLLGGDTLTINSGLAVQVGASQVLSSLTIANGTSVVLPVGGNIVIDASTINLNSTGKIDITNNAIVYRTTGGLGAMVAKIKQGQNGFDANGMINWNGTGITSSTARTNNVAKGVDVYGIGAIRNGDLNDLNGAGSAYSTFKGVAVGVETVLIRSTYFGDANLDGNLTIDDYNAIDGTFLHLNAIQGWASGDFDYNGTMTIDDYNAIDTGYLYKGLPL